MKMKKLLQHTSDYQEELIHALRDKKEAAAYLQEALDEYQTDGDLAYFMIALRNVAEAHGGISELAQKTQLNRQSLYRTLSEQGNPKLQTLGLLLKGLGFHLAIHPAK